MMENLGDLADRFIAYRRKQANRDNREMPTEAIEFLRAFLDWIEFEAQ